jgi:prepilin-type N-terminal cleavage/methylation domain-containing protein
MKIVGKSSQSGKSIIELLIVLVVAGIITTFAVMQIGNAQNNLQRQNLAREFKVNLERARFDAVKRRAETVAEMATITITSATSYMVKLDLNQDGILSTLEEKTVSFGNRSSVKIVGTNLVFPVTIRFNYLGQVTATNGDNTVFTPTFTFCEGDCTILTANATNANVIAVSPTGTVAMLSGGETIPTYDNPTVTNVGTGSDINPWVLEVTDRSVITNTTPTPTPTPPTGSNPTPSPTPTGTDSTPTPTATPIPTATPTPTPNVVYCTSGQRPSQTGCTCKLPMTVRSNGKCM